MPDQKEKEKESRWGSLLQRSGGIVDRLTDTVKEVGRGALLKQALDARERGNLPAAFWLLEEAARAQPDDLEVCVAFWDVAVDHDHHEYAFDAVARLIERHASRGEDELACQYWYELASVDPDAIASPAALTRILPALQQKHEEAEEKEQGQREAALLRAVKAIVDDRNDGLTVGVAFRVAELARELDRDCALKAAHFCLDSEDLHDVKRRRLAELVLELDPEADIEVPEPEPEPAPLTIPPLPPARRGSKPCPARNHPLRAAGPDYESMSDEELDRLALPPARPAPPEPRLDSESLLESGPELETGDGDESEQELSVGELLEDEITQPLLDAETDGELEVDGEGLLEGQLEVAEDAGADALLEIEHETADDSGAEALLEGALEDGADSGGDVLLAGELEADDDPDAGGLLAGELEEGADSGDDGLLAGELQDGVDSVGGALLEGELESGGDVPGDRMLEGELQPDEEVDHDVMLEGELQPDENAAGGVMLEGELQAEADPVADVMLEGELLEDER